MNSFLKWVGSKRQLLPEIKKYIPKEFNFYYEPFLGSGAVLFDLQPKKAIINDTNKELINCYITIRDFPNEVIHELNHYFNTEKDYYRIRKWDQSNFWPDYFQTWERAARFIYINKNGFNGLWRVNKQNQCNVPYGKHEGKYKPDVETIMNVSNYLKNNDIEILNNDFEVVLENAKDKDFVYIDSPYDIISDTANFTNYTKDGFTKNDQIRLRNCFVRLSNEGCFCLLSNADTEFIRELYKDFEIISVEARRNINSDGNKRGKVGEVLVRNYI